MIHQSEFVGTLRCERFAGEDDLHCGCLTDGARQTEKTTCACDEIALDLGETKGRPGRRDDQVAGQNDFTSPGGGKTVDGNDDRLAAIAVGETGESTALGIECRGVAGIDGPGAISSNGVLHNEVVSRFN